MDLCRGASHHRFGGALFLLPINTRNQKSMKKWKFFKINFFAHWKVYNNDIKHCEQSQKCLRRSIDRAQNYRYFCTEVLLCKGTGM